ncbi:hypothetical protein [Mycobacterium asiaticum]|uniref:DSBA-like thioredoxin domain-containing protein n=1 Tax=Mycobacterium asiaticum TaxID=1790 RepID=A0A1A3KQB5_MYCAS|nr:hypothetical protein [Mycobacterium asiaticum]OBJ87200.1 hypothetical protein A5640_07980 [Mycobacterium asiaticum]
MTNTIGKHEHSGIPAVTMWFDPVCPYTWNTARWLHGAAIELGFDIDWQLANLAILNEGRELPPPQQTRMADSARVGRLMAAIQREMGTEGLWAAYFTFGQRYFAQPPGTIDDGLIHDVLTAVDARETTARALSDASLDELLQHSHRAGQDALGEPGGSPILSINDHAFFGPVLTAVPPAEQSTAPFDAIATLAATAPFAQLQRPRADA